jgi:hypothetical protein
MVAVVIIVIGIISTSIIPKLDNVPLPIACHIQQRHQNPFQHLVAARSEQLIVRGRRFADKHSIHLGKSHVAF